MYALKSIQPSQFTELSRAFSDYLASNNVQMVDRRTVTAFTLGKIVGGSLPVSDLAGPNLRSDVFRDQHLASVKAWLGRVGEAISIDHELVIAGAFFTWSQRCCIAFPAEPATCVSGLAEDQFGNTQQTAVLLQAGKVYPNLNLGYALPNLLTVRS